MRLLTGGYYRPDGEMNQRSNSHQVCYRESPVRCVCACVYALRVQCDYVSVFVHGWTRMDALKQLDKKHYMTF